MTRRPLFSAWLRATLAGWALGVPAIVIFALLAELLRREGLQTPVGAGMGLAVGFFQSRVVRGRLGSAAPWFWASFLGLAAPFLALDVARWAGVPLPYSLSALILAGGLVAGIGQAVLLRLPPGGAAAWVGASALGWGLAARAVAAADSLVRASGARGLPGALAYLGFVAAGGVLLAGVTGFVLVRLPPKDRC